MLQLSQYPPCYENAAWLQADDHRLRKIVVVLDQLVTKTADGDAELCVV